MPLLLLPLLLVAACSADAKPALDSIVVVTFNTGTSETMGHDEPPADGYTSEEATLSDEHYGNGLAWVPVVEDAKLFLERLQPDLIAFQEIFYTGDCESIPSTAREGFVCQDWQVGDPTVANLILGAGYQVACHQAKPDKCLAVRTDFGRIRGCDQPLCLDALEGATIAGCGGGSRLGRAIIDRAQGESLTVTHLHGTSGFGNEDKACRTAQFEKIFEDFGDGEPAASGALNIVLGDFNTDPVRMVSGDASARRLADFVGEGKPFRFVSDASEEATPTYGGFFNIDHVISDAFKGDCYGAGTDGHEAVSRILYFDHVPLVCHLAQDP